MSHRILVPFELPDAEPLSSVLVDDVAPMEVVALGHYGLPEQTPLKAARAQFEDDAQAELDALVEPFREAGSPVTTRLVFGKERGKTIDRVALEEGCDAELDPAPTGGIERILVPLVDTENLDRIADFVTTLYEESTWEITLFHVVETGFSAEETEDADVVAAMLDDARERLLDRGYEPEMVDYDVVEAEGHDAAILQRAGEYDAVVMGEASPNLRERVFGTLSDKIAQRTGDPVIIVRRNV
jgi:nucleotide-binding universal stress UspA family protein